MGTINHTSLDFGFALPWPESEPGGAAQKELSRADRNQRRARQLGALQEARRWKPAVPEGSRDFLDTLWKTMAERVGAAARMAQDGPGDSLPSVGAKAFSHHLPIIKQTLLEAREGIQKAHQLPHVRAGEWPAPIPRPYALAYGYLRFAGFEFDEAAFARFLAAVQEHTPLQMSEIWNLKPFLEFVLLEQIAGETADSALAGGNEDVADAAALQENPCRLSSLLDSLARVSNLESRAFFESVSSTEKLLRADPQGAYSRMDSDTREAYRAALADFAAHSKFTEPEIAGKALALARLAQETPCSNERAKERRTHVGYYLVDAGQIALKKEIGYRPPLSGRIRDVILKWPDFFYLLGIEVLTIAMIALLMVLLHVKPPAIIAIALFVLPALECAVTSINLLTSRMFPPRKIPKLDFSDGIPGECATVVAVPALLTSESQVRQAVKGLEIRFLANRDANLHFALLTDLPDSPQQFDDREALAGLCCRLVRELDEKYARASKGRFFHFHRHRMYNPAEKLWMGWERKRGKLLDFNRYLLSQSDRFPVKAGDTSVLKNVRYVITLDLDTQLPPGAGQKLVGTLAHPLNRAVIDPVKNIVVEGYGILQPRVDISIKSATRSRFASLLSGDTGFDIYTRAVSDVYQDLFGEGIFTGKGIYEVEAFQKVLQHRFPCNAVLSHDLIEGAYARAGLVSDVEVVDDYPSHFSAFSRRKHRWVRGDWQLIFYLLPRVRNYFGQVVPNPLSHVSQWKILDNLRRSLTEAATMLLFLYGWLLLPGDAFRWTLAAIGVMLFPACFQMLLTLCTAGKAWFRLDFWGSLCRDIAGEMARMGVRLAFLCHQSLIDLDAVVRAVVRMKFTHRRLLEWETAADAELADGGANLVDVCLKWSLVLTLGMVPLVYLLHPRSLGIAMPFLLLWAASAWIGEWLNRPNPSHARRIKAKDREEVRNAALRTWRFFSEFCNAGENWLIPDIVQETPPLIAHRVSPTNLGLLLNSRLAAHDLGFLTAQEFIRDTEKTFDTIRRMPKCKGHLYNWYETATLEPVPPLFVSTVDNGNLVCSLWTLKHGCLEMIRKPLLHSALWAGLCDHAVLLAEVVNQNCAGSDLVPAVAEFRQLVEEIASEETIHMEELRALEIDALIFLHRAVKRGGNEEVAWWTRELSLRLSSLLTLLETFAPWLDPQWEGACLLSEPEIREFTKGLTLESLPRVCGEICEKLDARTGGIEESMQVKQFRAALERSIRLAEDCARRLHALAGAADSMAAEMDFSFLYDAKKKLFSIGYEEEKGTISEYNYDLLASEARAAVFAAIAKGEAPQASWFQLKRSYRSYMGEDVVLSWSGTMFEYLMPSLWVRAYPNTLLDRGIRAVLRAQQKFGQESRIPWGISESSCAERNPDGHYRYHAFGVPGVALHRDDCTGDLVVAPYATFLAMMVDPHRAVENLRKLKEIGCLSAYGFYEAADFTPRRNDREGGHIVVRNWMAHHQAMCLVAAANVLCDSAMQRRFHAEPRVAAAERVLHEKLPRILAYEEDAEAILKSAPALADVAQPMPHLGMRDPLSTVPL